MDGMPHGKLPDASSLANPNTSSARRQISSLGAEVTTKARAGASDLQKARDLGSVDAPSMRALSGTSPGNDLRARTALVSVPPNDPNLGNSMPSGSATPWQPEMYSNTGLSLASAVGNEIDAGLLQVCAASICLTSQ